MSARWVRADCQAQAIDAATELEAAADAAVMGSALARILPPAFAADAATTRRGISPLEPAARQGGGRHGVSLDRFERRLRRVCVDASLALRRFVDASDDDAQSSDVLVAALGR